MNKRILFVCLGNICRSPLAEGIMLHLVKQLQLPILIDSAGTASYHVGEAPDKRTIKNALKHGIDLSSLRARVFEVNDFDKFDLILTMDESNVQHVLKLSRNKDDQQKVNLFLEVANGTKSARVPDPYYGAENDFETVFQLVYHSCEALLLKLQLN